MENIFALTDYQGFFESKYDAIPYLSGMNKGILEESFINMGYKLNFTGFSDVINYPADFWKGKYIIYTSSEDTGYHYKSYIEDVVYYLELCQAIVIPSYKYLKANNNKVFMELLRSQLIPHAKSALNTKTFGCLEEAEEASSKFDYPVVFKQATGAMSKGVGMANDKEDLFRKLFKVSRTRNYFREIWEYGRSIKYPHYKCESRNRRKFIIQNFIPGLAGDFKVLIFTDKYYILKRGLKSGDFRASGSGIRIFERTIPDGLLKFAYDFFSELKVPNASLDIAYDGKKYYLIEFQCLYFGSYTLTFSDFYWKRTGKDFQFCEGTSNLERIYSEAIVNYIKTL